MQKWIDKYGVSDERAMVRFAKALTDKYGEAAATQACQMFEEIAAASNKVVNAVPANVATFGEVADDVYGCMKQSPLGKLVPGVVEKLTKQAAEDTMLQNAQKNNAEWAWVPDGGACVFCRSLAANGWQHLSKSTKDNHAEHIHANCNCEFAIRFNKNDGIQGHNFEEYKKEYEEHKDDLKAWRRELEEITKEMQSENPFINPKTPLQIEEAAQNVHIVGTPEYNKRKNILMNKGQYGPSFLEISMKEAQELVDKFHGHGRIRERINTKASKEIILDNDKVVGTVVDNRNGNTAKTTVFKIHYSKNGTHIVPDYPSKKK